MAYPFFSCWYTILNVYAVVCVYTSLVDLHIIIIIYYVISDDLYIYLRKYHVFTSLFCYHILAVSTTDGIATSFYSDPHDKHNEWGGKISYTSKNSKFVQKTFSINLALFVLNFIELHQPSVVVMKLDIEGYENYIIPHMYKMNAFCNIDMAYIEVEIIF